MRNLLFVILLAILSILYSCLPGCGGGVDTFFGITFFNASDDTVSVRIFGHKIDDEDSIITYLKGHGNIVYPSDSVRFYWLEDVRETGDVWESLFAAERIDTLYVRVTENTGSARHDNKDKIKYDENCLKSYKYSWDDVRKSNTSDIKIIYP